MFGGLLNSTCSLPVYSSSLPAFSQLRSSIQETSIPCKARSTPPRICSFKYSFHYYLGKTEISKFSRLRKQLLAIARQFLTQCRLSFRKKGRKGDKKKSYKSGLGKAKWVNKLREGEWNRWKREKGRMTWDLWRLHWLAMTVVWKLGCPKDGNWCKELYCLP